ncbi:uncharacterized protein A4U43_C04F4210 [Asparagus officinalis]|uniref:Uncharacterized protein n=1 Tax=Asparagus officinalis TaxID=4686 RepID=A0A5P1EYN9_ASPOF|nr:uncharacterized protein LOC109836591 [Asparagus officinalis]ONK71052.1 uncharacterized protein A4U43_C04F4210 [Asparagus officinalis]
MAALASSLISPQDLSFKWRSEDCSSKLLGQSFVNSNHLNLSLRPINTRRGKIGISKRQISVQAGLSGNGGRSSTASVFVGGFLLGGLIAGALGYVYAPKIGKALDGTDKKDLMRKLPKFIYDEDKALEKTRKVLEEKIAQLNSAIDGVSSELRADDAPNGAMPEEIESAT